VPSGMKSFMIDNIAQNAAGVQIEIFEIFDFFMTYSAKRQSKGVTCVSVKRGHHVSETL